jgi:hypothetical protein
VRRVPAPTHEVGLCVLRHDVARRAVCPGHRQRLMHCAAAVAVGRAMLRPRRPGCRRRRGPRHPTVAPRPLVRIYKRNPPLRRPSATSFRRRPLVCPIPVARSSLLSVARPRPLRLLLCACGAGIEKPVILALIQTILCISSSNSGKFSLLQVGTGGALGGNQRSSPLSEQTLS